MSISAISDWRLMQLTLQDIGPFRSAPATFDFRGQTPPIGVDPEDGPPRPANLYMLIAKNGFGKTTVLSTINGIFALLGQTSRGRFDDVAEGGVAQLDIRATWAVDGVVRAVLLSIWLGSPEPPVTWTEDKLEVDAQVGPWAKLCVARTATGTAVLEGSDELGRMFYAAVRSSLGVPPTELLGGSQFLPTVLYFPADRLLQAVRTPRSVSGPQPWGYEPAYSFSSDGPEWENSVENVLIWLEWVDAERLRELLKRINANLFDEPSGKAILPPERADLISYVVTNDGAHQLAALSHGERALLQMYVRIFCHMTINTVLLIDEIELHLHTKWMHKMYISLKKLLGDFPAMSMIFTTHDREIIQVFDDKTPEPSLTKGGFFDYGRYGLMPSFPVIGDNEAVEVLYIDKVTVYVEGEADVAGFYGLVGKSIISVLEFKAPSEKGAGWLSVKTTVAELRRTNEKVFGIVDGEASASCGAIDALLNSESYLFKLPGAEFEGLIFLGYHELENVLLLGGLGELICKDVATKNFGLMDQSDADKAIASAARRFFRAALIKYASLTFRSLMHSRNQAPLCKIIDSSRFAIEEPPSEVLRQIREGVEAEQVISWDDVIRECRRMLSVIKSQGLSSGCGPKSHYSARMRLTDGKQVIKHLKKVYVGAARWESHLVQDLASSGVGALIRAELLTMTKA